MRAAQSTTVSVATLVALTMLACASPARTQPERIEDYFVSFPKSGPRNDTAPQTYELEYNFFNRDIAGTTRSRTLITADYTRGLEDGGIRWNGVRIASTSDPDAPMSPGDPLEVMEGFQYGVSEEIVQESLYERFPNSDLRDLIKTMVWDGMMIEMFDMMMADFEGLRLNEFHDVPDYEGTEIEMCGWGTLKMRDLRLKWSGVSRTHGELCAVILYQSLSNPVDAGPIRGRSCYWGQLWISLEDWQIECLTLNEDIVLEIPTGDAGSQILDMQRRVKFEKTS
jgi:hypothetical protein